MMMKTRRRIVERTLKVLLGLLILTTLWIGIRLHQQQVDVVVDTLHDTINGRNNNNNNNGIIRYDTIIAPTTKGQRRDGSSGVVVTPSSMMVRNQNILKNNNNSTTTNTATVNLWHNNPIIPSWLKDYMDWHTTIVSNELTSTNWKQYRYFVLRCYRSDERCGGVSDRLKPIPLLLLASARTNRIFFIHWDRPYNLEEFLQPPPNGLNWTVPHFLVNDMRKRRKGVLTRTSQVMDEMNRRDDVIVKMVHIHDALGGSTQYDELMGKNSFSTIFHDLFRIMFQPSPGLQQRIEQTLSHATTTPHAAASTAVLRPGRYSVAHYRAEYGREVGRHPMLTEPSFIHRVAINSIRCAIQLQPGDPIYFASDNIVALKAVRDYAQQSGYPIYTFDRDEDVVLKLDDYTGIPDVETTNNTNNNNMTSSSSSNILSTSSNISSRHPSDYYSTFVDLYLAGNGNCVTFGRGGFGRFANLLSYNSTCAFKHVKQFYPVPCKGSPPLYKSIAELRKDGYRIKDE